jgi:hypothetical protein
MSSRGLPIFFDNLTEASMGVAAGFEAKRPESASSSRQYFCWLRVIPSADLASSSPKKYLSSPMSLILNF